MKKRRSDAYVGVHLDFMARKDTNDIGRYTTMDQLNRMLDRLQPDFVQCDCKHHYGIASYKTEVGTPAAGFIDDAEGRENLVRFREATAARGIPLYVHYSGLLDRAAVEKHPEWAAIDADGVPSLDRISLYSSYLDELMIPQFRELIEKYGIDGAWVDGECWGVVPDYCDAAVAEFKARTGLPDAPRKENDPGWDEFLKMTRENFFKYVRKYTDAVHAIDPDFQITSNWLYMPPALPMTGEPDLPIDFVSGDSSPSESFLDGEFDTRYAASIGKNWDLMPWHMGGMLDTICTAKGIAQVKQEAAAIISQGGAYQMYYRQRPDGSIREYVMELPEAANAFCRERREWCRDTKTVPQIGILSSPTDMYESFNRDRSPFSFAWCFQNPAFDVIKGYMMSLLDAGFSVDVVQEYADFTKYPMLLLPETIKISDEIKEKLLKYAENGGKLILAGPSAAQIFEGHTGVKQLEHWNLAKHNYMRAIIEGEKVKAEDPAYDRAFRMNNYIGVGGRTCSVRAISLWVEAMEGTEVLNKNYAIDDFEYFGEHARPAVTLCNCGRGQIASIWFNMGYSYVHNRSFVMRDMMADLVNAMGGTDLWVEGSHFVHAALREKDGRTMIQLLNTGTQGFTPLYAYDEIVPIHDIQVKLKNEKIPAAAYLQPDGQKVTFTAENGVLTFHIPVVRIHEILEIVW